MIGQKELNRWFDYHSPNDTQRIKLEAIGNKAKELALEITRNIPEGPEQTVVLSRLREAVYTANGVIAGEGFTSAHSAG